MANRGKRGGSAAPIGSSTPSPSSSSPTAAAPPAAAAHPPPASVWGKGGFNPLTSPASHAAVANGVSAADKSKDKDKPTPASSSTTTPTTAPAQSPATATAANVSSGTSAAAPPSSASSTAPAASSSSSTPSTTSATPTPVSSLAAICQLGNTVHVTTPLGEKLEGVVYVYDAAAHILALEVSTPPHTPTSSSSKDYTLLNTDQLHISLVHKPATPAPRRHLPPLDHHKLQQREAKALNARTAEAAKIGHNVTPTGQRLFDALAKLYEARWDGTAIVLMGVLRLEEPYGAEQLTGGSVQQRQRIVKTIEAQREKEERK